MKTPHKNGLAVLSLLLIGLNPATAGDRIDFDRAVAPASRPAVPGLSFGADPKGKLDLSRQSSGAGRRRERRGDRAGQARRKPALGASRRPTRCRRSRRCPTSEKAVLRMWLAGGAGWGTDPIDPFQVTTTRRAGRDWWSLQPVEPAAPAVRAPRRLGAHADRSFHSRRSWKQTGSHPRPRPTAARSSAASAST